MKIKICGVTRPEDAELGVKLGATHIGCQIVPEALRTVTAARAKEIFAAAGKAERVLVFHAEQAECILECVEVAGANVVQLHQYGEHDAQALEAKGLTVIRVFDVLTGSNLLPSLTPAPSEERPALLDVAGGTSEITFPWELLGPDAPDYAFVSGSVRPENVCALLTHHPYGIDVSTGLEITPGIKDPDRVQLFFDTIERALR